jgi:uncharacterized protein (DUF427 family)
MSLTTGTAPHSARPAGRFHGDAYVEPFLRRVRALAGGRTLIDSERVLLVHRLGQPPTYAFPAEHVRELPQTAEPAAEGYVHVPWNAADAWYEEEDEVFGGHPRNPYHRIDCVRAQRRLRVEVAGIVLVDTSDVVCLYETSRPPQLYARPEAIRRDLLVRSETTTYCPYKGTATHWSAQIDGTTIPDVAWSYDAPLAESVSIAGLLSFYSERTTMLHDVLMGFPVPPAGRAPTQSNG